MLNKIKNEIGQFNKQPHNFRILVLTNLVYAFVLPVIDIFVAAYVMRNSNDPVKVVVYQLTIYTGIPLTFLLNGVLLRYFNIKSLYAAGMMLSAVSMIIMMSLKTLNLTGIGIAGIIMGISFGFYWANRDYLALATTSDHNRNYYYGLETFFYTIIAVVVPVFIGWFIELHHGNTEIHKAYKIITGLVLLITVIASVVCYKGSFGNPVNNKYIYLKFHPLWNRLLVMALLKGLAQGFLVTAPAMLIMLILGKEGTLGTVQSAGAVFAALIMYILGRFTGPAHRIRIFTAGLVLFALAALLNGILFNKTGVLLFMLCLLIAKPLLDLAYFPIQFRVIDVVSKIENRGEFAYILNHETGLYAGRFLGAGTFIVLAYALSTEIALRYAIIIIALFQLASVMVAKKIIRQANLLAKVNSIN
ncbi:MFS transporter [Niastella vici]|uniref:MFS transporter n=1 Tax=Niastella vici TaxID=1703345 RepID=A0A1V9FU97_9BACT|nr:MFS transporter [Niastella vici]OQP61935.1 MFS transporter [Niastella vici]